MVGKYEVLLCASSSRLRRLGSTRFHYVPVLVDHNGVEVRGFVMCLFNSVIMVGKYEVLLCPCSSRS